MRWLAAAVAVLATAPAAQAVPLSDERTLTRYAHAATRAPVFARPSALSEVVGRLRHQTEDGPLETYLALARRRGALARTWIRVRLPGRPNGGTGWVRRNALGPLTTVRTYLRVDRGALRATLYRRGHEIWTSRIGVGAPSTPTPAGRFWIRTRLEGLGGGTVYGPYAFGTAAYSVLSDWPGGGVIGIHGTNEPWLIPGRPSHGCIRVPNANVRRLARLLPIGTPVRIV
jgi:lipoprotein-anchoring transpeptidase ErfK/SrfK